jgi:intraflagellar transport protein 88
MVALDNDASCVEALYNLGLCNKKLGIYEDALEGFFKLQSIVRNHSEVVYHIANIYELMGDNDQATEWYLQLLGLVPTDPGILQKVGAIFDAEGDKQQAYQYHFDSYKNFPSNLEVIDWLGSYFIEMQVAEKAIVYFERAALMQPDEVKWRLMIASCFRRAGNYHRALDTYKAVHRRFPENVECLKFLVKLCTDMGLREAGEFALELKKAERAREAAEQRALSSRPGSRRSSSRASLASRTGSAISHGARCNAVQWPLGTPCTPPPAPRGAPRAGWRWRRRRTSTGRRWARPGPVHPTIAPRPGRWTDPTPTLSAPRRSDPGPAWGAAEVPGSLVAPY